MADPPIDFTGPEIVIKPFNPGSYNLCLTYQDPALHNCFAGQPITVGSLPKLNFQISGKDVSCPGGSDGSINVKLSAWAGDFQITANGETIRNNPDYTFGGLAANTYPVKVADFCYNEAPVLKTINQPNQVVLTSVVSKNPTCLINPNGGFKISAAGGTNGSYDYYVYIASDFPSGSPVLFSATQGSVWENYTLPAGSYVIRVRDNTKPACDGASSAILVLQPVVPLGLTTIRVNKVKCFGESTGEIEVAASGGSGIYKFNIDSYALTSNPAVFTALKSLNYTVILHNSDQNCPDLASKIITVETNPQLSATLTPRDANCFESKDGQINTIVAGGSGIYNSFSWEQKINGNWFPHTSVIASPTNLYAGEYRLKVTDSDGCSLYTGTIINQPSPLAITTLSSHDLVCYGNTGSINVSAAGGNGGYSFFSSANYGASYTGFTSGAQFSEGSYLIKVRDSKGCEVVWEEYGEEKEVNITGPFSPLNLVVTPSNYNGFNISGYGKSDGSLTLIATGGNGERGSGGNYSGYVYSLSGRSDQTSGVYSNLGAGEYTVKVTDGRGCSFSKSVTLTQPDILNLSVISVEPVKCNGSATGKITVSGSGGVSPYTYQLNNNGFVSSNVFSYLLPGIYQITVRDRNGYIQSISETVVNKNEPVRITLLPQDVKCFGELNGQISTTITGGSGGFVYLWQKWLSGSWQTYGSVLPNINLLGPGRFRLKVTDSDNCSAYDSTIINQPTQLTVTSVVAHDIICYGSNGSIDISATGSKGGYRYFYSVNDGASYTEFATGSPLSASSYKLKVTDSNGCNALWNNNVKITGPPTALNFTTTLSMYNGYNISCYGKSDGSLTINATGGNGNKGSGGTYSGYSFSFAGGSSKPENVYTNLIAGSYNIVVTDARGCSVTGSATLTQATVPVNLQISKLEDTKCFNDSSGVITLLASGGAQPYEYMMGQENFTANNVFGKLPVGNYNFTVRDKNGCSNNVSSVITNINPKPGISLIPNDIKCYQKSDGEIQASFTGGSGNFGLKWFIKNGKEWLNIRSDSSKITGLPPGDYRIQVTDLAGCPSLYDSTKVYQNVTPLVINQVALHDIICYGGSGSIEIAASGSNGGYVYQYSKNSEAYLNFTSGEPLAYGSYKLKVKDIKGCEKFWPEEQVITQPTEALGFTWTAKDFNGSNVSCYGRGDGEISVIPVGGNGAGYNGYTYVLSGRSAQTETVFGNLSSGNYNISITDGRGCTATRQTSIIQPASPVDLTVQNVVQTKCFNDSSGIITLSASGGVQSYEYMMGQGTFNANNKFEKLPTGNYQFTVRDKNGCTGSISSAIGNIYPKPSITLLPEDIRCFQKSDGIVGSTITGGSGNFGLKWYSKPGNVWQYLMSDSTRITGLSPGTYRIGVTDLAGCPAIFDSASVYQKVTPLLIDHVTLKDIVCYGDSGRIDIEASGSNGGYIYQYSKNAEAYKNYTSGSPLPFGGYKLKVRDVKGCETLWPDEQVITQPSEALGFTWTAKDYNGSNVSCFGKSDGEITVTPIGGNGGVYQGYTYLLSGRPVQAGVFFGNLNSGNYNMNITDGRGCSVVREIVILQPASPVDLTVSELVNTRCFNDSSGVITLAASGGVRSYEYMMGQGSFKTDSKFAKLPTGNYEFTVRDKNGCTSSINSAISNIYPKPSITLLPEDIRCYQKNDGIIGSTITGGSGNFGLKWYSKPGNAWRYLKSDSIRITGLSPGTYRIEATDLAGCPAISDSASVYEKVTPLLIDHVIVKDIVCYGDSGRIDIEASGSNGGYIYQYSKNNQSYVRFSSGNPLPGAEYQLKVTDAKGCVAIWPEKQIITSPAEALDLTWMAKDYNGFNVSCYGNNDGRLVVLPSGGNGAGYKGYSFHLSGRALQTDTLFENMKAGTYSLSVTDGRGCIQTKSISLTQAKSELGLWSSAIKQATCINGADGRVTLVSSGGNMPFTYSKDEEVFVSGMEFTDLSVGDYRFTVKDANGCTQIFDTSIINIIPEMKISGIITDASCVGKNSGSIKVSISGGAKPFSYQWKENLLPDSYINKLYKGDYSLSVLDSAGCEAGKTFKVGEPDLPLVIDYVKISDIICLGDSGSFDIKASGSNGGYFYQYSQNNQSYKPYSPGDPLPFAEYRLRVIDLKGCTTEWTDRLSFTRPSEALGFTWTAKDYNGSNVSCYGRGDGEISVIPVGGNGAGYNGYTYVLSGRSAQTETVFGNLSSGNYNISITDGRGCTATRQTSIIQPASPVDLTVQNVVQTKCFNDSSGIITLSASGGVQSYEYMMGQGTFNANNKFEKLPTGNYQFTVRDKNGCTGSISSAIGNIYPKPSITLLPEDIRCFQKSDGIVGSTITGGSGNFGLKWYSKPGNVWQYLMSDSTRITGLSPGTYRIGVTDLAGCPAIFDSASVYQKVTPLLIDHVTLKDIVCYGDSGRIDIEASGSNGGYIYQYSKNAEAYKNYTSGSPLPFGGYKLKVRDVKGCETLWPDEQVITQPSEALGFTWTAKDYNGSNVSCFGKSDGELTVTPSGGNGSVYRGYTYLMSGRSVQTEKVFGNLSAGSYIISITDGRGCTVTRQDLLVQQPEPVGLKVLKLEDTKCFNDSSGVITVAASGGVQSYEYMIGQGTFSADNKFVKLPKGNYQFTVRDKNGCTSSVSSVISNIYPKPVITLLPEDIKCYQQSDGIIGSTISGGSGNFGLKWYSKSGNVWQYLKSDSIRITRLTTGFYRLEAIDRAGCPAIFDSTKIYQKVTPLNITAVTQSACVLIQNGTIISSASGGSPPYLFGVDDNTRMQSSSSFIVYGGEHKIFVLDKNNCAAENFVKVNLRNTMPMVNFMVATSRYALDTLVLKDVSVPMPNRVSWEFSPFAKVITTNQFDAKIKFEAEGVYPVKMTGYFETCEYSVEKLINIAPFDPQVNPKEKFLAGIESVQISPNPNDGQFEIKVKLYTKQQLQVKVLDYYSKIWYSGRFPAAIDFSKEITIPGALPGTYVIWVISENDSRALLFIISQ